MTVLAGAPDDRRTFCEASRTNDLQILEADNVIK